MTIGEVAVQSGVAAETIRYYERSGVLPAAVRGTSGYRHYGPDDVSRLAFIRRARALGFSLAEVRELVALGEHPSRPCRAVDQLARAQLAQVEARIAQLTTLGGELRRLIQACRNPGTTADCRILQAIRDAP